MKKTAVLMLSLIFVLSAMTACNNTEEANVTSGTESTQKNIWSNKIMEYEVDDLYLNKIDLGQKISQNKLTMINYWATFCGPCIEEMPTLAKLEEKYKDSGFEIIGLTSDIADPMSGEYDKSLINEAKSIVKKTGVNYPVYISSKEVVDDASLQVVPTTIFVDSMGNTVGETVFGSNDEASWDNIIKENLEKVQ